MAWRDFRGGETEGIKAEDLVLSCTKKDGTNIFCSCREASDATYFQLRSGKLYRLHHWNIYTIA
jgi:hypothetical protein